MDEISLMTFYEQNFMDEELNFYGIGFFHEIFVAREDFFFARDMPWASGPSIMSSTFLYLLLEQ
jgi:hypothetical protein